MSSSIEIAIPGILNAAINRAPIVVTPETPLLEAIAQMSDLAPHETNLAELDDRAQPSADDLLRSLYLEQASGRVLVVENRQVVGLLTERDVVRLTFQQSALASLVVGQVMTPSVVTLCEDDFTDAVSAARLLCQHQIECLPVVDKQNHLLGIVTQESLRQAVLTRKLLRSQQQQLLIADIALRIRQQVGLEDTANAIVREVQAFLAADRVVVYKFDSDMNGIVVAEAVESSWLPCLHMQITDTCFQANLGGAYAEGRVCATPDIYAANLSDCYLQLLEQLQVRANLVVPILVPNEETQPLWGLLIAHQCSGSREWEEADVHLLQQLAVQLAIALKQAELYQSLQTLNTSLEQKVEQRTQSLRTFAERERLISTLSTQIRASLDCQVVLDTAVQEIRSLLNCDRAIIYDLQADFSGQVVAESITEPERSVLHSAVHDPCVSPEWIEPYRQGKIRVVNDIHEASLAVCHAKMLTDFDIRAKLMVPIVVDEQLWGLMLISHRQAPRHWQPDEIELVKQLSVQISIAVQQANIYKTAQTEIAHREQTEALLRDSEQRYASLAATAPVGIFRIDLNGDCVYANARCAQMVGLNTESLLGQGWQNSVHETERRQILALWKRAIRGKQAGQIEYRFRRADGEVIWVYGQIVPEQNAQGSVIGHVGTLRDITQRKQAELALQASEATSRAMLEAIPDLMVRVRADGTYRELITKHYSWNLMPPDIDPAGLTIADILPVEAANKQLDGIQKALQTGKLQVHEQQIQVRGWRQDEEVRIVKVSDDEVLLMVRDISDRKRAERALKTSEQRFRRLFEAIPNIAVQGYDRHCRVMYWNNASELFYGYTKAEAIGQQLEALIIPPEMRQQVGNDIRHWLDEGQPIPAGEMNLMHKDGSRVAVFSSYMLIENAEGETELYCVDVDLRPLKQAEMTLRNLVEGTAATIGHEFFPALVRHIAEALEVDYVLVTEKVEDGLQTLAFWAGGTLQPTYKYRLTSTPCEQVIERGYFYVKHSVQQAFPDAEDVDLGAMEAESYLGVALRNNRGKVIGNLCILHRQPIRNADRAEQILRVFAARAAAELERQRALMALEGLNQRLEIQVSERTLELREREARYRALVEVMPDLLIRLHADGTYLDVIVGSDITLLNPEHFHIGANIYDYDVISPAYARQQMFYARQALQTREIQFYEYELVIEGRTFWEDARIIAITQEEVLVIIRDITERKQAENALQESRQFIQTVLDTIPIPVFWKDRDSTFLGCNQLFAEAMGVQSALELIGKTDFDFATTRPNAVRYRADDYSVITSGKAKLAIEETFVSPEGKRLWLETHKAPLQDSANNIMGVVGTFLDVTGRKQVEVAMRRQLAAIEAAIDGIGILQDGNYIYVNQSHVDLFGYDTPEELIGQPWSALHSIDEVRRFDQVVLPILNQAKSWQGETIATRKDGSTFTEGLSMTLTEDRLVICVCRDVSDRKFAEAALRSSENRYRAIFNQVAVGIKQVDSSGQFISANRAFCEMLGYTKTEVLQLTHHTITHPDDLTKHQLMYEQLKEGELPLFLGEKRYRHKAGHYVWTQVAISTLRDQNDHLLSYVAVVVNIDNRKKAEQELLKAKEAAEAADRAKSVFLANMSHELRTPLNAILGFTQLILHEKQLDAETHEHLDIVNRSGKHLLTIINDVLEMSKIEAGKVSFTPRNFDLYALLWSLEGMFSLKAQTKDLQLVIEYHPDVPRYVEADEGKLRQILTNLLSNAVKFTPKGHIVVRVRALAQERSTTVDTKFSHSPSITLLFEVADTGPGIASEEQALLFKPFMQTEAGQLSQEGTGLGLTISQHFARVMGSEIQLDTTLGKGTTFFFELDVLMAPYPNEVASDLECRTVKHIKPAQTSYRLLVVEDNRINRLLLVRLLENAGFEVQSVEDGGEAVERAQHWKPHLIWMDIHMPIMDGYEATRRIKSAGLTPGPIILALTASVFESDKQRILSAGCDDFLGKPFQSHQIFQKIAQYLPVDYVYSKESAEPHLPSNRPQKDVSLEDKPSTDSSNLASPAMPEAWFKSLYQAAVRGSDNQVIELARALPPEESALMHALEIWVEGFRFDAILEWLQNQSNGDSC